MNHDPEPDAPRRRFRSLKDDETLRLFVRNLGEGVYITSAAGEVLDANPACLWILGVRSVADLNRLRTEDLVDPEVRRQELEILEREGHVQEFELTIQAADGVRRTVLDTAYRVTDELSGETYYHGILVDITARKELERQLEENLVRDQLTGCHNRRHLAAVIDRLETENATWGVVVIDVDHFKELNDREGHLAGDRALVRLGRYLTGRVRLDDVVVRFGGDEFLVVVHRDAPSSLSGLVQRLRQSGGAAGVEFSLGWALREGDESFERTIHRADQQLIGTRRRERNPKPEPPPEAKGG